MKSRERRDPRSWQGKKTEKGNQTKVENLRKATKCYISSLESGPPPKATHSHTHRCSDSVVDTHTLAPKVLQHRARERETQRERESVEECRAANRKTPFFQCPGLMRLQQMRRLPAVHHFCFFFFTLLVPPNTHTHCASHILWLSTIHHKMSRMTKS